MMNIFQRLMGRKYIEAARLGCPAVDEESRTFRLHHMAQLNPSGFRTPPRGPRVVDAATGETRADEAKLCTRGGVEAAPMAYRFGSL